MRGPNSHAAIDPVLSLSASITITPAKLDFGVQAFHSESQPATVTLSNESDQTIELSEIIASGIDFVATNHCQTELPPGARCIDSGR